MDQNLWKNCNFVGFLFSLFRKACLIYKTSKIFFSRFIFAIYDMGILGVTKGFKWLQVVTRVYKALKVVTRGDKGLQGVTRGDNW